MNTFFKYYFEDSLIFFTFTKSIIQKLTTMKKYIVYIIVISFILILSCNKEYTCECTISYNNVQVDQFDYTATGQTEKELCDDADREQTENLTHEVLDSLINAGFNLSPTDTVVTYKRVCEAK